MIWDWVGGLYLYCRATGIARAFLEGIDSDLKLTDEFNAFWGCKLAVFFECQGDRFGGYRSAAVFRYDGSSDFKVIG